MGIQVNMILLADKGAGPDYISPLSYKGMKKQTFFAFNASTPEALEKVGNATAMIAARYSGIGYGQVDNFIIGNEVNAWETSNKVTHNQSSPYVKMANLEILTDFLALPEMLNPKGEVRSVKIAELGYSSHTGENDQAASVVFAYLVASNNSHVDGIVILREADNKTEIKQGIKCGLCDVKGNPKKAFTFYQNPLDPNVIAQASAIAGVDLNSLVVPR